MYLLDTHVLVWAIAKPGLLSKAAASAIQEGELAVSAASLWELLVKKDKPGAPIQDPGSWWRRYVTGAGVSVLPIQAYHIQHLGKLPEFHKDPFDRILLCQAIHEGLRLVTGDEALRRYHKFVALVW